MPMARKTVVLEGESGIYHCTSRCVRRAFLCGTDFYSGKNYDHRKGWIRDRLKELSQIFGVEVYAYAVMANHLHLVVRVSVEKTASWSEDEVVRRWRRLFPTTVRDEEGYVLPADSEVMKPWPYDPAKIKLWRERLGSLSWLMRCLNESIARRANREDKCKGCFWESRFHCQRLADEGAVLACMAYVDLNPVRAGVATSPEASEFTSIYDRIVATQSRDQLEQAPSTPTCAQVSQRGWASKNAQCDAWLCPLELVRMTAESGPWLVCWEDYLELVDWTGRCLQEGKRGAIPPNLSPILNRLELNQHHWVDSVQRYGGLYYRVAGSVQSLARAALHVGQKWFRGLKSSREMYRNTAENSV